MYLFIVERNNSHFYFVYYFVLSAKRNSKGLYEQPLLSYNSIDDA